MDRCDCNNGWLLGVLINDDQPCPNCEAGRRAALQDQGIDPDEED